MFRVEKLVLLAVSLWVAAATFALSNPAEACSPPPEGWYWSGGGAPSFDEPIPTDGVIAFRLSVGSAGLDRGLLSVEVRDAHDSPVDGTLSFVTISEGSTAMFGAWGNYVAVWKPSSPLAAEATYELSVEAEHPYESGWLTIEEVVPFETASGPVDTLPTTTITSAEAQVSEERAGFECCTHNDLCDSCGDCESCWATRYAYHPSVSTELDIPSGSALAKQVYTEFRADGERQRFYWNYHTNTSTAAYNFAENSTGPFCVEVATISLITGDEIHTEEECFDQSDLPSYTERQLTGEGPPPECAPDGGQPDAGSSDVGTADSGTSDTGQFDGESQDAASADTASSGGGDGGGGCSQPGPAVPPVGAMMVVVLGLGVVRWRSVA